MSSSRSFASFLVACLLLVPGASLLAINNNPGDAVINSGPPSLEISADEASGSKYRKIALNGAPLPDERPQQEEETDQNREETYVDALTLTLRHDTTDTYVTVPASDLAVSVRRSAVSETWSLRHGLRPNERKDRPFGIGWSSNLGASIHVAISFADRDYYGSPDTVTVTDENGGVYTFAILYNQGTYWNNVTQELVGGAEYVPIPSSRHDHRAFQTSLVRDSSGKYIFKRKYGSTLTFDPVPALANYFPADRIDDSYLQFNKYARLLTAEDRYGNILSYNYESGNDTLLPDTISDARGIQLTITKSGGVVTAITDARGKTTSYSYTTFIATSNPLIWDWPPFPSFQLSFPLLESVTAPDGGVTHYEYEYVREANQHPDRLNEPQLHLDLTSITDPLGHTYEFLYQYNHSKLVFWNAQYYIKTGLPRQVSQVTLPTTEVSHFATVSAPGFLAHSATPGKWLDWFGLVANQVTDASGNARIYEFDDPVVEVLQNFTAQYGYAKFDAPRMVFFTTCTIKSYQGADANKVLLGTEEFTFDPIAGMALTQAVDFSGNTTTFEYGDDFKLGLPINYYLGIDAFGNYDDPTSQTNALAGEKTFTYGVNRIMTSVTDEAGTITRYRLDAEPRPAGIPVDHHSATALPNPSGRRLSETVTDKDGVVLSHVTYDFPDTYTAPGVVYPTTTLSKNFVTRKIVHKVTGGSSEPSWVVNLVTEYRPDAHGRVAKEIVDPSGLALTTEYTYDANGNKLTSKDPRGHVTTFAYDARNRLRLVTYADATTKEFFYDARGNKKKEVDENGVATLWDYDALNRVTRQVIDMNDNAEIDPAVDLVTSFTYNPLNAKVTVTDPKGTVSRFDYDALQRLVKKTEDYSDPVTGHFNYETVYEYGANCGGTVFNSSGFKPTRVTDPRGYTTEVTYDDLYRPTQEKVHYATPVVGGVPNPLYATTLKAYDAVGNLLTVTDPLGTITKTTYDGLKRPLTRIEAFGTLLAATTTTAYTTTGLAWLTTDPLARETRTTYDAAGRPVKVFAPAVVDALSTSTTPVSPVTETIYDAAGNVSALINPLSRRTDYTYDVRNRRTVEQQPSVIDATTGLASRPTRTTTYDDVGNVIATEDARGFVTTTGYDPARRPLVITAPLVTKPDATTAQPVTAMTYDKAGNVLTLTDANGHVTVNTYDALNRLTTTTQSPTANSADNIVVANEYDAAGNRTAVIDGKLQRTEFTYDGLNRNTSVKDPASHSVAFEFDAMNKTARVDSESQRTEYTYDVRHRLAHVVYVSRTQDNRTYGYDAMGRLLSVSEPNKAGGLAEVAYTYDALGRQLTETSNGKTHTYAYDLANNRVTVTYGGTGTVLTSTYDVLNRLDTLSELPASGTPPAARVTTYSYDLNGNQVYRELPNGEETDTVFDALNRRTEIVTIKVGGGSLLELEQAYDLVGNVIRITESYPGSTLSGRTVTNTYDRVNRLVVESVVEGAKTTATTYAFDKANNRTDKAVATTTSSGTTLVETAYVYNSRNQLQTATEGMTVTGFTYDLNGNRETRTKNGLTDTYVYDYENRLVSLAQQTTSATLSYTYTYDYRTRRIERTENGTTTRMVFSGGVSVAEYPGGTPTVASAEYIRGSDWGGGVGGLLYSIRSSVPSFKHYNSRGDVISATNAAGTATWQGSYEAFGTRTQEVGTTLDRQKANTKEEDPTGLLNEGFRYRCLETGVFVTRDPLGFVDGPNMYAYVVQNPWSKFDPLGLKFDDATFDSKEDKMKEWKSLDSKTQEQFKKEKWFKGADDYNKRADSFNKELGKLRSTPFGSAQYDYLKSHEQTFKLTFGNGVRGEERSSVTNNTYTIAGPDGFKTIAHEFMHLAQNTGDVKRGAASPRAGILGSVVSLDDSEKPVSFVDRETQPRWMEAQAQRAGNIVDNEYRIMHAGREGAGKLDRAFFYKPSINGAVMAGMPAYGDTSYPYGAGGGMEFKFSNPSGSYSYDLPIPGRGQSVRDLVNQR